MRFGQLGKRGAFIVGATLMLALTAAAFFGGRAFTDGGEASAEQQFSPDAMPDTSKPFWHKPWKEWEAQHPTTDKIIAGVTVGPKTVQTGIPCTSAEARNLPPGDAAESLVAIEPGYLPAGVTLQTEEAVECRGQVISHYRSYSLPLDEEKTRAALGTVSYFEAQRGGYVEIYRAIGDPIFTSGIPDYRWEEAEVGGGPAALAHPLIDAGYGLSMVIFHDGDVLTFVRAMNLSLDELLEVAEGLR